MRTSKLGALGLAIAATTVHAAGKTSIYIDQIPGYSALAPCAENRVSAIVRAQASGCGDDQALTSFSCFCIDQYTHISSIISTAVQDYCSAQATTLPATLTAALPEVTSAIDVFNDYCARSTELAWYQQNSTSSSTPSITPAPSSPTAPTSPSPSTPSGATSPSPSKFSVPVAAIAAPVVVGVLAIAGIVGLLFFLRRRKSAAKAAAAAAEEKEANPYLPPDYAPGYAPTTRELGNRGVHEVETPVQEVVGDAVKYRYELETRPAELEGDREGAGAGRK